MIVPYTLDKATLGREVCFLCGNQKETGFIVRHLGQNRVLIRDLSEFLWRVHADQIVGIVEPRIRKNCFGFVLETEKLDWTHGF